MKDRPQHLLCITVVVFACWVLTSCGSNMNQRLTAVSITPTVAHARGSTVQFVATGAYAPSGSKVTPINVFWTLPGLPFASPVACTPNGCPQITSQGLATCGTQFTGPMTVTASAPVDPKLPVDDVAVPRVSGTATLICP